MVDDNAPTRLTSPPSDDDRPESHSYAATVPTPSSNSDPFQVPPSPAVGSPMFSDGSVVAGRYRIVRFIAKGGMGEVYEAEDLVLKGNVALKTIRPEIATDGQSVERFKREIHLARKITHPNICRIYDLGMHEIESSGTSPPQQVMFLSMEMLSGPTLSERLKQAPKKKLSPEEALPIVEQLAAGLDAAHGLGIIHRDFKSANVVLAPSPDPRQQLRVVITDFGLARGVSDDGVLATISVTGMFLGTPAYCAPEQVQGLELTPAADLYALGIVMYEMVTGRRPFEGSSVLSVATKRLTEAPTPPRNLAPDLDPLWEAVILRCLERDPKNRFDNAIDAVQALRGERPVREGTEQAPAAVTTGEWLTAAEGVDPERVVRSQPGNKDQTRPSSLKYTLIAAVLVASVAAIGYLSRHAMRSDTGETTSDVPEASAPAITARTAVAVLGPKNLNGSSDTVWLSAALAETTAAYLGAGDFLRVIDRDEVAMVSRNLGLGEVESVTAANLQLLRLSLGADAIVTGSYQMTGEGEAALLSIDLRLHDTRTSQVQQDHATGTQRGLYDLVERACRTFREDLGAEEITAKQQLAVTACLPSNLEATRLFCEGSARLREDDPSAARNLLAQAVAADPEHPLPHAALARAWAAIGNRDKAREEAQRVIELSSVLPTARRLEIDASAFDISQDYERAIESYHHLTESYPDVIKYGLELSSIQTAAGKVRESIVTLDAMKERFGEEMADPRLDIKYAKALFCNGDFANARDSAQRGADKAQTLGSQIQVAEARLVEGSALRSSGDLAGALAVLEEASGLLDGHRLVQEALELMAQTVYQRGDLDGANRLFARALAKNRELGYQRGEARTLLMMAQVLLDQGRYEEAEKHHEEALRTFTELGARFEAAAATAELGYKLLLIGELAAAQTKYQEAMALFGELGSKAAVAATLTNIAEIQFFRGQLDQAKAMHEEALAINREIGDRSGAAYDTYRLGEVHAAKGEVFVARSRYQEAITSQEELGEVLAAAETRIGLAAVALAEGKAQQAESLARQAEELLRSEGAADLAALAQSVLASSLLQLGRPTAALEVGTLAQNHGQSSADPRVRFSTRILAARLQAASGSGDAAAALANLQAVAAEAEKAEYIGYALEARLAGGEIEVAAGNPSSGRARLAELAAEARAKGFGLIARRADAASG